MKTGKKDPEVKLLKSKTKNVGKLAKPAYRKKRSGSPTLADSIAECLRLNINDGSLSAGVVIHTAELARFFNVSRIPVTRATEMLEQEGLIQKRDTQGYSVAGSQDIEQKLDLSALQVPAHLIDRFDRQPSWERVYDAVETELVELMPYGRFQINESAMTAHYGLNRGQVQQIITRLSERGIAEKLSQSHCNLLAYDATFLSHRFELRMLLEPVALEKAYPHLSQSEVQYTLDWHRKVAHDFPNGVDDALPGLERKLHNDFLSHCSNPRILVALSGAQVPLITTTRMILRVLGSGVEEPLFAEHIAVLEPLAGNDPVTASAMLKKHLESSCARATDRLSALAALPRPAIPPFLRER